MTHEGMYRRPKRTYEEQDAFTSWRQVYCYLSNRPGVVKAIKRVHNKRVRREVKQQLRREEL